FDVKALLVVEILIHAIRAQHICESSPPGHDVPSLRLEPHNGATHTSHTSLDPFQHLPDGERDRTPPFLHVLELSPPRGGPVVDTRTAILGGPHPTGFDEPRLLETMKRRIQRAFLDPQDVG